MPIRRSLLILLVLCVTQGLGAPLKGLEPLVTSLDYRPEVSRDFTAFVSTWKDTEKQPLVSTWQKRLKKARQDHSRGSLSLKDLKALEISVLKALYGLLIIEVSNGNYWDLTDVLKHKQANCVGYAQVSHILGTFLGFTVHQVRVLALPDGSPLENGGHVCVLVALSDTSVLQVDLVKFTVSKPFKLEELYTKKRDGLYLKGKENPYRLHCHILLTDLNRLKAARWYNTGNHYFQADKPDTALLFYERALKADPHYADTYNNIGIIHDQEGRTARALSFFRKALQADPGHAGAWNNIGNICLKTGKADSALICFKKVVRLQPSQAVAYYNIGYIYQARGLTSQALASFKASVDRNPRLAEAFNNMGNIFFNSGKLDSAAVYFLKTITADREHIQGHINLGITYARQQKIKSAKKYLTRAAIIDSTVIDEIKQVSDKFNLNIFRD